MYLPPSASAPFVIVSSTTNSRELASAKWPSSSGTNLYDPDASGGHGVNSSRPTQRTPSMAIVFKRFLLRSNGAVRDAPTVARVWTTNRDVSLSQIVTTYT